MGFKYLLIDSQAANQLTSIAPYKPQLDIRLDHPIENAIGVQLMSFSSPNDYYNVRAHADKFQCMLYNLGGVTESIERKSYTIPTGLYTITQLVDALNAAATASPFSGTGTAVLTPVFSLLASNKVAINCSSTGTGTRRFVLFSSSFHNSIVHRLGFSKSQVFTEEFDSKAGDDFFVRNSVDSQLISTRLFHSSGGTYLLTDDPKLNGTRL
jgi:hypothetical protein